MPAMTADRLHTPGRQGCTSFGDDVSVLDRLGVQCKTDKSSLAGGYLPHYDRVFEAIRNDEFNLVEIGVLHGGSVKMWESYFSRATIVGVDINPMCRQYATDRTHIRIGSQDDPGFLHRLAAEFPARIIIDDGSHRSDHIIFTFERLFPTLQPSGWYVVEDLHFHLMPRERLRLMGSAERSANEYFAAIANDRLRSQGWTEELVGLRRYLVEAIAEISFIPGAVIIRKQDEQPDLHGLHEAVVASAFWLNWLNYGMKLKAGAGTFDEVLHALQQSVAHAPDVLVCYERLADHLFDGGRREEAARVLEEGLRSASGDEESRKEVRERAARFRG